MEKQFSHAQLQIARKMDLFQFMTREHPDEIEIRSGSIRPKCNHSISIKQTYCGYTDFATGETGNSVDFLTRHMGYTVPEAVRALLGGHLGPVSAAQYRTEHPEATRVGVLYPEPVKGPYKRVYGYLMGRGISAETISLLVHRRLIYQDDHGNIIFLNMERDWGERRGTNTYTDKQCVHSGTCEDFTDLVTCHSCPRFKSNKFCGTLARSRRDGFWGFVGQPTKPRTAYICEGCIDAISLFELHRFHDYDTTGNLYAAIGGVAKQETFERISHHVPHVVIAVDNDDAGDEFRRRNAGHDVNVPIYKDWNEDLQHLRQKRGGETA